MKNSILNSYFSKDVTKLLHISFQSLNEIALNFDNHSADNGGLFENFSLPAMIYETLMNFTGLHLLPSQIDHLNTTIKYSFPEKSIKEVTFDQYYSRMGAIMSSLRDWGNICHAGIKLDILAPITKNIYCSSVDNVIEFNILIVGINRVGKTSFLNTLFSRIILEKFKIDVDCNGELCLDAEPNSDTIGINCHTIMLKQDNKKIKFSFYTTVGYEKGNEYDLSEKVLQLTRNQMNTYYNEEKSARRRPLIPDQLIHCCIYLIYPTGHRLMHYDVTFMSTIQEKMNLIPIIAKSDYMTALELSAYKKRIREDFIFNNIVPFPHNVTDLECKNSIFSKLRTQIKIDEDSYLLWSIINSNVIKEGKVLPLRDTHFGNIDLTNSDICDLSILQNMILRDSLFDLKLVTKTQYYENHRKKFMEIIGRKSDTTMRGGIESTSSSMAILANSSPVQAANIH